MWDLVRRRTLGMRWKIDGEREVWSSPWLSVRNLDVEQPHSERVDYHAVRLSDVETAPVMDAGRC